MKGLKKLGVGVLAFCCVLISVTAISGCSITIETPQNSVGNSSSGSSTTNNDSSLSGEQNVEPTVTVNRGLGTAINLLTGGYTDFASGTVSIFDEDKFEKLERVRTEVKKQNTERTYEENLTSYLDELVLEVNGKINNGLSLGVEGLLNATQGFDFGVNTAYEKTFFEETTTVFYDLTYNRVQYQEEIKGYKNPDEMISILSDDFLRHAQMVNNGEMTAKQFISIYGTHIITAAIYGAKCDVHYEVYGHTDKTDQMFTINGKVDVYNGVSCAIDGIFDLGLNIGGGAGVEVEYLKDHVSQEVQTEFSATAIGGDAANFIDLNSLEGAGAHFTQWVNSLNKEENVNYVLIDVPDESLYCVWDFLDDRYATAKQILTQYLYNGCNDQYEELKVKMGELYKDGTNIVLDWNDGETVEVRYVKNGDSFILPVCERNGYTFLGWYDENGLKKEGAVSPTESYVTYTAKWQENQYEIFYEACGGNITESKTDVTFNKSFKFPIPVKNDAVFIGWFTEGNKRLTNEKGLSLSDWEIAEDCIVYARWGYLVTLNADGGDKGGEYPIEAGESFSFPESKAYNRVFLGWYDASGQKCGATVVPTANVTYTAKWLYAADELVSLNRQNCAVDNSYNPAVAGDANATIMHSTFELINLTVKGCVKTDAGNYIVANGQTLSLAFQLLANPGQLSTAAGPTLKWNNWYCHKVESSDYAGQVYGTNINGTQIKQGAYYVKVNYTDGKSTESKATDIFAGMSINMVKTLSVDVDTTKQIANVEVVFVYELYYEYYKIGMFDGKGGFTNWRCSAILKFE
ncbi:MAG: InlB B-repeat-containing protein [Clostridia bacterium]|nr:InlB B-repeat-containing protein [Clostridia bacterium]